MDEKSSNLIKSLGVAYNNQIIKNNPELEKIIAQCARPLMGNDDDKVYFEVITKLTHGVAKYYQTHHNTLPQEIIDIYGQIKKDIPKHSANGDRLRQIEHDMGKVPFMSF